MRFEFSYILQISFSGMSFIHCSLTTLLLFCPPAKRVMVIINDLAKSEGVKPCLDVIPDLL